MLRTISTPMRIAVPCLAAMVLGASFSASTAVAAFFGRAEPVDYERQIKPLLQKHCVSCHGLKKQKAGLSLEGYGRVDDVRQDWKTWMGVLEKVKSGEMPPEERKQPTSAERNLIIRWLSHDMFPVDCTQPDPGRVTIRRLNRTEYDNTIRDLVGIDFKPAADFPDDSMGYGFDNNGDVLSVSPLLMEKYLDAAEQILDRAIVPATARLPTRTITPSSFRLSGSVNYDGGCCAGFFSGGTATATARAKREGAYRIRILAYGEQAGTEPARMSLKIDGGEKVVFDVKATEAAPAWYEYELRATLGEHALAISFVNDFYDPSAPRRQGRDRNLYVQMVEVVGPLDEVQTPPESHRRIFTCAPGPDSSAPECARRIVSSFARRAFRRPVDAAEVDRLAALAQDALTRGEPFEQSVKLALAAILVSPSFLFRGEVPAVGAQGVRPLGEFALASRLSYFLWSSMPDEALLTLAEQGKLRGQLQQEVRRMLQDQRSVAFVEHFSGQWLQIRNLEQASPDKALFPAFDETVRRAMRRETELFFEHVLRGNRNLLEFLSADYTFLNEPLAAFYGVNGVKGDDFRKVSLTGTRGGGLLTHGSVLTLTSNPTRTSPVKRGKWVLETVLNMPPPPPPPDVPPLSEKHADTAAASLRQRLEMHVSDPVCASCHIRMDPLGLAFEHFDAIGRWREKDGPFPIDDTCALPGGDPFVGVAGLRDELLRKHADDFIRSVAEQMLSYALGRGLDYYDVCAVDEICRRVKAQGNRAEALILAIADSVPFQMQRAAAH